MSFVLNYSSGNNNYTGTDTFAETTSQNAATGFQARAWEMSKNVQHKGWNTKLYKKRQQTGETDQELTETT